MGACKTPIPNLQLPSSPPAQNPGKFPRKSNPTRRLLLLSIPLCTTFSATTTTTTGLVLAGKIPAFEANSCAARAEGYDPVSQAEKDSSFTLSGRISEAIELLDKGRELQAHGDFNSALLYFTQVIEKYKDFAFSEYARVGRALALYEVGDKDEAIAEMEDVSISLKGYPEVHAALAAALYVDKHAPLLAENQFTVATLLDPHYTDLTYVKETKHWPPSLVSSLQRFITLS